MKRIALIVFNTLAIVGFVPMIACADGLGIPMSDFPDNVEAGPQLGKLTPTSVEITLHTIEDATAVLDYTGESGATGSAGPSLGTAHLFLLAGLEPETEYSYSLELDGQPLPEVYRFRTPSADVDAPYTFSVIGDPGSGTESQLAIVAALEAEPPDFLLTTGDNAYLEGQRWQVIHRYLVPFADLLASIPFYPSLGNHEYGDDSAGSNGGIDLYLDYFTLPGNERYFDFKMGPVHFFVINSEHEEPDGRDYGEAVKVLRG